jgi:hypothetical protein
MSYTSTGFGKVYDIKFSPSIGPDFTVKVNVPIEQITSDIGGLVGSAAAPRLKDAFDKNWPYIKDKIVEVAPGVINIAVNTLKRRKKEITGLVEQTSKPFFKKTGFYVALGAIATITALAIVQKRTQ